MSNIVYTRGDSTPISRTVTIGGVPIDVSGWSFRLVVNAEAVPDDLFHQEFELEGVLVDAPAGEIEFRPSSGQTDLVGTYYYEIESTDAASKIGTLEHGEIIFHQDITKMDELIWTAPTGPSDGDTAPLDGSIHFTVSPFIDAWSGTYETQDGRRVIRIIQTDTNMWSGTALLPKGDAFPMKSWSLDCGFGHEWRIVLYVDRCGPLIEVSEGSWTCCFNSAIDTRWDPPDNNMYWANLWDGEKLVDVAATHPPVDTTGWPLTAWYEVGLRVNPDRTCDTLLKQYGDADNWRKIAGGWWQNGLEINPWPYLFIYPKVPTDGAHVDLWRYEWRRVLQ